VRKTVSQTTERVGQLSKEGLRYHRYKKIRGSVRIAAGTGYLKQLEKLSATASVESVDRWDEDQKFLLPFPGKNLRPSRCIETSRLKQKQEQQCRVRSTSHRDAQGSNGIRKGSWSSTPRQFDLLQGSECSKRGAGGASTALRPGFWKHEGVSMPRSTLSDFIMQDWWVSSFAEVEAWPCSSFLLFERERKEKASIVGCYRGPSKPGNQVWR